MSETPARLFLATLIITLYILFTIWILISLLPTWLLITAPTLLFIYFFEHLPWQHHWNPSVRSLYPYRQSPIEKELVARLQTFGLVHRRSCPQLPTELWSMILQYSVYIPIFLDTTCEPKDFQLFISSQLQTHSPYQYYRTERRRRRLGLVCKSWYAILRRTSKRFVEVNTGNLWLMPSDAERVNVFQTESEYRKVNPSSKHPIIPSYTTLSILAIETLVSSPHLIESNLSTILQFGANVHSLRSFVFQGNLRSHSAPFLAGLQHSFRSLTTLALTCSNLEGNFTLEKLENLYIDVDSWSIDDWWFPSLRQLAFGTRTNELTYGQSLVRGPVSQLQSLLLPKNHASLTIDNDFWITHPNLQFLGTSGSRLRIVHSAPFNHPLAYLWFSECKDHVDDLDIQTLEDNLNRIPNLKMITMPPPETDKLKPIYPPQWLALFHKRKRRGLVWLDKDGEEITYRRQRRSMHFRKWEWIIAAILAMSGIYHSFTLFYGPLLPTGSEFWISCITMLSAYWFGLRGWILQIGMS